MADISELLANSDLESLKRLINLRDKLGTLPSNAPQAEYINAPVFGKQVAQDVVNAASIPGKTAADSAEVFSKMLPEGIEAGKSLMSAPSKALSPVMKDVSPSLLSKLAPMMSKVAMPLTIADAALASEPSHNMDEELASRDKLIRESQALAPMLDTGPRNLNRLMAELNLKVPEQYGPPAELASPQNTEEFGPPASLASIPPARKPAAMLASESVKSPAAQSALQSLLQHQDSGLADAQRAANASNLYSNMSRVGNNLATALSGTLGAKADNGLADAIAKNADSPIDAIKTSSDLRSKELAQNELMRKLNDEIQQSDPNSPIGKINRKLIQELAKVANFDLGDIGNISTADSDKMLAKLSKIADSKQSSADRRLRYDELNALANRKLENSEQNTRQRKEIAGNKITRENTKTYTDLLDRTVSFDDLMDDIENGRLKTAQNVAAALEGDISALLTRTSQTAVYDRSHAAVNALQKTINTIKSYAKSEPENTVPVSYLKQFKREVETLKNSMFKVYGNKVKEMIDRSSDPDLKNMYERSFLSQAASHGVNGKEYLQTQMPGNKSSNNKPSVSTLKEGDIEDGHQFLGGNPADPKSWKQVE